MRTQKQRIFSLLVLLTMVIVLTCIFVACDKGGAQDKNYTVTIHPDNGQADFVWDTKTDIPVITKYGYHIVGYYLDADMTISTTLESLKTTNLTAGLNVYVKWEKDSVPPKTKIVTNNLLCNYDTRALSGKVSNSTMVFSFNDEISVEKGTTYTISTDINGINVIPSKTVNLEIGDNIFYVLVSNEDELTLYTATVRRKPIYTVTFDTLGGTEVEAQQVEEDAFATAPTTEKNGCTFEKWDWDFSMPITENTTITAIWNAFVYNIVYDFNIPEDSVSQEVDNSMNPTTYTVDDTIYFSAPRRNGYYFTGWSVSNISKGTTRTVTTTAQWSPITYEIIYDFNDENSVSKATNNDSYPRYYCVENEITFAEPTRTGYTFVSWDKNIEKGTTGTQTVTASWDVNQYNIEYVLNGWTNAENNKAIYTIEDKTFALSDGMNGESLFCGWYLDDEYTNCIETIDASTMRDYKVYAMPDCGATKGLTIENGVVKGYLGASNEVIIPSFYKGYAVNSLIESSFKDCVEIVSVEIPDSVTSIDDSAFRGCRGLTRITVAKENTKYHSDGNCLIETESKTLIAGCKTSIIPMDGSVTIIGDCAFDGCRGLTSITIPDSVTNIGDHAFYYCTGLTTVNWNATKCTSAGSYNYPIFAGCSNLATVNIGDNITAIPLYAFSYCTGLTSITIPNSVTSIYDRAFYGCAGLTSITIPDSLTSIYSSAFSGCDKLQDIYIKDIAAWCNISGLDNLMWYGSSNKKLYLNNELLTSFTIPNGVRAIYSYAFYKCSGLTNVTIPDSVTSIGWCAFEDCTGLTSISIPHSVTYIGNWAFRSCSGLKSVTIGNGVTSIGERAFYGCSGLTRINFNGTKAQWSAISKGSYWKNGVSSYCNVYCTDGTISI